jgi:hypothetical protein
MKEAIKKLIPPMPEKVLTTKDYNDAKARVQELEQAIIRFCTHLEEMGGNYTQAELFKMRNLVTKSEYFPPVDYRDNWTGKEINHAKAFVQEVNHREPGTFPNMDSGKNITDYSDSEGGEVFYNPEINGK